MVDYAPTMVVTGNGESGFDSGEGALETATTSKEGSRRANYPGQAGLPAEFKHINKRRKRNLQGFP